MLIEVPDTGIRSLWDKLFLNAVAKEMRDKGLGRCDAKEAARAVIGKNSRTGQIPNEINSAHLVGHQDTQAATLIEFIAKSSQETWQGSGKAMWPLRWEPRQLTAVYGQI